MSEGSDQADDEGLTGAALDALVRWRRLVEKCLSVLEQEAPAALRVIPAALDRADGAPELRERFDSLARVLRCKAEMNEARKSALAVPRGDLLPLDGVIEQMTSMTEKFHRQVEAFADLLLAGAPGEVAVALGCALGDPSGNRANRLLKGAFELQPIGRSWQHDGGCKDRKLGAFELLRAIGRNYDTYRAKPRAYYATAIYRESKRDFDQLEAAQRDRLGLTPKGSSEFPAERRRELNQSAEDWDTARDLPGEDAPGFEDRLLDAAEERERAREVLAIAAVLSEVEREHLANVLLRGMEIAESLAALGRPEDFDFHTRVLRKLRRRLPRTG